MAFSAGVFSKLYSWVTEQASPPIELSKLDAQETDFAAGLSNCLLRDGTGLPTANIDWNGKRLTNLGAATTATDALNLATGDLRYALFSSGNTWTVGQTFPSISLTHPTDPRLYWVTSGSPANNQRWDVITNGIAWQLRAVNDADSASTAVINVNRTGLTIDAIGLAATNILLTGAVGVNANGGGWSTNAKFSSVGGNAQWAVSAYNNSGVSGGAYLARVDTTAQQLALWCYGASAQVGSVTTDGTSTSYNTTSDERLKTSIVDAPPSGAVIDAIRVRSFDWVANGRHVAYGVIAQELDESFPEAVTQGDTWSVDPSKLVPLLIKEVQALRKRVCALESPPYAER